MKRALVIFMAPLVMSLAGCGAGNTVAIAPNAPLVAAEGDTSLESLHRARYTVLVFFTAHCPVQKAHDARMRELADAFRAQGVAFVGVASEVGADAPSVNDAARARGLPFPVVVDRGARLADALGVEYSTHVVVLGAPANAGGSGEARRSVLYSGAIDSDGAFLSTSAKHYLRDALSDLVGGAAVRTSRTEALGCPLRKR